MLYFKQSERDEVAACLAKSSLIYQYDFQEANDISRIYDDRIHNE